MKDVCPLCNGPPKPEKFSPCWICRACGGAAPCIATTGDGSRPLRCLFSGLGDSDWKPIREVLE